MSEVFHLSYCCKNKQENLTIDMAKIQIKSENLTPLRGIFRGVEQFLTPHCHL